MKFNSALNDPKKGWYNANKTNQPTNQPTSMSHKKTNKQKIQILDFLYVNINKLNLNKTMTELVGVEYIKCISNEG